MHGSCTHAESAISTPAQLCQHAGCLEEMCRASVYYTLHTQSRFSPHDRTNMRHVQLQLEPAFYCISLLGGKLRVRIIQH